MSRFQALYRTYLFEVGTYVYAASMPAKCGNYRKFTFTLFNKNFVKVPFLLKKSIKS